MKGIILAGGPAKKLKLVTGREGSRSLLKFPRGYLIDLQMNAMLRYFDSVVVVSDDNALADYCYSVRGCVFVEQRIKGVEGALCSALASSALLGERLVTIMYGDIYSEEAMITSHLAKVLRDYEPLITVTKPVVMRGSFLRVSVDPIDQQITAIGQGSYVFAGLITLDATTLRELMCSQGIGFHDAISRVMERGLRADIWIGEWVDLDTPWDYLLAIRLDLEKLHDTLISRDANVSSKAILEGPVIIEKNARVDHYAVVKGPAYVGRGALIGAHSFVRDHVAVFDSAIVGAYAELKRSVAYSRSQIGSHSYIADSIIGYSALLAPYTLTLNTPYEEVSEEVKLTSTQPLERLKVGAVIPAYSRTRPREVIKPASIYQTQ